MKDVLTNILKDAGFEVTEGAGTVKKAIKDLANNSCAEKLCSGWRVFPDGDKCQGCRDCEILYEENKE